MSKLRILDRSLGHTRAVAHRQQGAATLVVVMVLFFIISMVAAYTSRNLIFEQRTSANQYRSTQALEAADAGLQWALGMLNSGRIDASCVASNDVANNTFRQRYLNIIESNNASNGNIVPFVIPGPPVASLTPSCVFNGANWVCSCPSITAPTLVAPGGTTVYPAFRVRFTQMDSRPGMVQVESNGCTRYAASCLDFPAQGADNEGRATVRAIVALKGGLSTVPAAAMTVRGSVNLAGAAMTVANADKATAGITIQSGGAVFKPGLKLLSVPGTPADSSVIDVDTTLSSLSADRMFANVFGMWRATYRDQPGAVVLPCGLGGCSADLVRTTIAQNPGRVLWLEGNFNVDTAGDVASAAEPVAIVVNGSVSVTSAAILYGLLYVQAPTWTTNGALEVRGAVVAEGDVAGNSTARFVYDPTFLTRVRLRTGSFALVPGSWRDFQ